MAGGQPKAILLDRGSTTGRPRLPKGQADNRRGPLAPRFPSAEDVGARPALQLDHAHAKGGEAGRRLLKVHVDDFGPVPLLALAREFGLVEIIDPLEPRRNRDYTVGEHPLIAVLNRFIAPGGKMRIRPWFDEGVLPRLLCEEECPSN